MNAPPRSRRTRLTRGRTCAQLFVSSVIAIGAIGIVPACTNDFDQFGPKSDDDAGSTGASADSAPTTSHDSATGQPEAGVVDAVSPVDTGLDTGSIVDTGPIDDTGTPDTSCVPDATCLKNAQTCAKTCTSTDATCEAACPDSTCTDQCKSALASCDAQCGSTCNACTTAHGCSNAAACASVSQ